MSSHQKTTAYLAVISLTSISRQFSISKWRHQMETFSVLLALCVGNSTVTGESPSQRPLTRSFDVSLICAWTNGWANNRDAGNLRHRRAHYEVTVMCWHQCQVLAFPVLLTSICTDVTTFKCRHIYMAKFIRYFIILSRNIMSLIMKTHSNTQILDLNCGPKCQRRTWLNNPHRCIGDNDVSKVLGRWLVGIPGRSIFPG